MCDAMLMRNLPFLIANPSNTATATSAASTVLSNGWTIQGSQPAMLAAFVYTSGTRTSFTVPTAGLYTVVWTPLINMSESGTFTASLLRNGTAIAVDGRYAGGAANSLSLHINMQRLLAVGDILTFQLSCTSTSGVGTTTVTLLASAVGTITITRMFDS